MSITFGAGSPEGTQVRDSQAVRIQAARTQAKESQAGDIPAVRGSQAIGGSRAGYIPAESCQ